MPAALILGRPLPGALIPVNVGRGALGVAGPDGGA
jgi:hypothetical protein